MITLLWKYFFEDDVDSFREVLARVSYNASLQKTRRGNAGAAGSPGTALATSPTLTSKSPKHPSWNVSKGPSHSTTPKTTANATLTRLEVNWGDSHGVTLLHHIASSSNENASEFALALLQLPILDLYVQDEESRWTALHRALYFGNITIARALMNRDIQDAFEHSSSTTSHGAGGLIKIKDREGNSPFDVYGASITTRNIRHGPEVPLLGSSRDDDDDEVAQGITGDASEVDDSWRTVAPNVQIEGDELFAFGSNKNFTLGFGDEDDRQFPERIHLERPDLLIRRLCREHQNQSRQDKDSQQTQGPRSPTSKIQIPAAVQNRPIIIQDVQLSKLHSAILTTDPEANLYMCGFGSGGRLGMGDETTRFAFVNVHGGGLAGKKVIDIALGQNHTIAISSEGETFTWGSNAYGQLGFAPAPQGLKDEEPLQLLPRQIFGPLKRELVIGAAASRIHSVVHTSSSLYTFGKNEGQLGLVDSDARLLASQNLPRKVAASLFSSPIGSVSAIEKATVCLLENHDVWVFANYGYTKILFPLDVFSNYFLSSIRGSKGSTAGNQVCKITSGGDTICAMSSMGDVFTVHVTQKMEPSVATTSTTNPAKIRGALSAPQRVWSLKKSHMAVRDVDVSQDGSIIICTESGSVWQRVKRAKIKDASVVGLSESKAKDYKFSRVPGLTRIAAVRSSTFGAFAAVRRDIDVLKSQVEVESYSLWRDLYSLLPLHELADEDSETENPAPRFWTSRHNNDVAAIRRVVLTSTNFEQDVADLVANRASWEQSTYNLQIGTSISQVRIPAHDFVLGARSEAFQQALMRFRKEYFFTIPEVITIEYDDQGQTLILFQGVDFITVFNFVLYAYTDSIVDVWHHTRHVPKQAFRYRQIRTELMKIASNLNMHKLEQAVRVMQEPPRTMNQDFEHAIRQPGFFDHGDVEVELSGENVKVHTSMMVQRCPFFEGLFKGRSAGLWLSSRREDLRERQDAIKVDLSHVNPRIFQFALRHIYADSGEEMFDDVVTTDLDTFLDLILEVLSVANELMLDRLAQSCQKIIGRYVNTRNVCQLLNAVAPCSITQFKDAALEYICLNLEGMLENRILGELDEDLMLELDEVVRQNQLTNLPIAKSGRADADLIEKHPQLLESIERGKRTKVDALALQTHLHEREARVTGSKVKAAFLEDFDLSPSAQNPRPTPSQARNSQSKSPALKPKRSTGDFMFDMDEDGDSDTEPVDKNMPTQRRPTTPTSAKPLQPSSLYEDDSTQDHGASYPLAKVSDRTAVSPNQLSNQAHTAVAAQSTAVTGGKRPWGSPLDHSKLDMKDIMAQDSSSHTSDKSPHLSTSLKYNVASPSSLPTKLSQRERKIRQQQQTQPSKVPSPQTNPPAADPKEEKSASPWQIGSRGPRVSLKDVLADTTSKSPPSTGNAARTPSPMTLRQTIAGKAPSARRAVTGPAQLPPLTQTRSVSTPDVSHSTHKTQPAPSRSSSSRTPIHSVRHTAPPVEATLQLSMADILSQQQTEKEIIKEAAAKRSLQEIQEEQAFQEWWDEESRRVRAEEEEANKPAVARGGKGARGKVRGGSRGRGRGRGKGAGGGGDGGEGSSVSLSGGRGGRDEKKGKRGGHRGSVR